MKKILAITSLILPNITFAAACDIAGTQNLKSLITKLTSCFLTPIAYLLVSTSIVLFVFGVFKFMSAGESEKIKYEGKEYIFWGIVGIFVMVSMWGLVNILQNTFRLQ